MDEELKGVRAFLAELQRRRVYRVAGLYAGGAFVLWQVAEIAVPALHLPEVLLSVVVGGSILGFPLALVLAWLFEVRRETGAKSTALAGMASRVTRRSVGALLLVGLVAGAALVALRLTAGPGAEGTRVAVFPFATVSLDENELGEGIAELVVVGLDGVPGLSVIDPGALWQPLLQAGAIALPVQAQDRIRDASRRFDAARYVTGTVVQAGRSLEVSVRVHDGRSGSELHSLRASADVDQLGSLVNQIVVDLVGVLWDRDVDPNVPDVQQWLTANPEALKAYLAAMSHQRRGDLNRALEEVERSVGLDSTFALAHVAHLEVLSWVLRTNAQPLTGLTEIVDRALRYSEALPLRGRLRVRAAEAMNWTDGAAAAAALEQILDIDPTDVSARFNLSMVLRSYGWQIGAERSAALEAYEAAIALDSTNLPLLENRVSFAFQDGDYEGARTWIDRMKAVAPESPLTTGVAASLSVIQARAEDLDSIFDTLEDADLPTAIAVLRWTRKQDPARAELWCRWLMAPRRPTRHQSLGRNGLLQIWLARGRLAAVDSATTADPLEVYPQLTIDRRLVAAALVGVGREDLAHAAASALAQFAPADSLPAYIDSRPEVWAAAWAAATHHAVFGDTLTASAYVVALDGFQRTGTPPQWPDALMADINARLSVRRGSHVEALALAQSAYELWRVHDPFGGSWYPEPALRFHLAERLSEMGRSAEALPLYRSFVDNTWVGFYTAVAALRAGRIEQAAGRTDEANALFRVAAGLWETGDADVVGELREEVAGMLGGGR